MTDYNEIYKNCVFDFNQISNQLDIAIQTCKEYGEYYVARGNVETEYGKKLISLLSTLNPQIGSKSKKQVVTSLLKDTNREYVSDDMRDFLTAREQMIYDRAEEKCRVGKQMTEEIGGAFNSLAKDLDTQKKKITTEVLRKMGIYNDVTTFATRSEAYYLSQLREMK